MYSCLSNIIYISFSKLQKRDNSKRIFRWGKRSHIFRYGKRLADIASLRDIQKLLEQQKEFHRISNRNSQPQQGPYVPFRFGE